MLPCFALLIAVSPAQEISAAERVTLPVVVVAPAGRMQSTSRTELLRAIATVARDKTDLDARDLPDSEPCLERTRGGDRLRCLVTAARPKPGETDATFLLVVSVLPSTEEDRLSAVLLDTARASEIIESIPLAAAETVDVEILKQAVLVSAAQTSARGEVEVEAFVRNLFDRDLRPLLVSADRWGALGAIEIHTKEAGLEIALDGGTSLGVTSAGVTRLVEVRAGRRKLLLSGKRFMPTSTELDVERGQTVEWRPTMVDVPDRTANDVVFWSGVGLVAAGVVVSVIGAAGSNDLEWRCFNYSPSDRCAELTGTFRSLDGGAIYSEARSPASLTYGSLAIGLAAAGATALVLNVLLSEDGRFPWLEIFAGAGAGAVGFSTTYFIDRSRSQTNVDNSPDG